MMSDPNTIPSFFAGAYRLEETVSGGTGDTPDDAVADYFGNYADDEIDYYTDLDEESGVLAVEVWSVVKADLDDQENYGEWQWMVENRIETREFEWKVEADPDFPGMNKIVYSPLSKPNEL